MGEGQTIETCRLVYDVCAQLPPLWFPAIGVFFIFSGVVLWRTRARTRYNGGDPALIAAIMLPFSVLWTLGAMVLVIGSHVSAQRALENGTAHVVEGPVEQFEVIVAGSSRGQRMSRAAARFLGFG